MSKTEILKTLKNNQEAIQMFGVKRIALFGSFAKGQQTINSDVDILVEFKRGQKTFDNFMDLKFFLEKKLRRKIDLVTKTALKPSMRSSIEKHLSYARF